MNPPSDPDDSPRRPQNWRFAALFFLSLGGVGLAGTYFSLYLRRRGVSNAELGVLYAIGAWVGAVAPMAWGVIVDVLNRWRLPVVVIHVMAAALFPLFWFWPGEPFWAACLLMASVSFFVRATLPLAEAWTLSHIAKTGADYGVLRGWGSVGYMLPLVVSYFVLESASGGTATDLLPVFIGFSAFHLAAGGSALAMPEERVAPGRPRLNLRALRDSYLRPFSIVFFVAVFSSRMAFEPFYAFFSLYLDELGIPDNAKGLFWTTGVAAEIVFMAVSKHVLRRVGNVPALLSGITAMSLRYYVLSLTPAWPVVLLSQLFHALTYGAFHVASVRLIYQITPEAFRASGQTFHNALLGTGGIFGSLLGGLLADRYGIARFFRIFSVVAAGTLAILVSGFAVCRRVDVSTRKA